MAQTADIRDFSPLAADQRDSRPTRLKRLWDAFTYAMELRAIYRIEQEAGHLVSPQEIARIRADFATRHAGRRG